MRECFCRWGKRKGLRNFSFSRNRLRKAFEKIMAQPILQITIRSKSAKVIFFFFFPPSWYADCFSLSNIKSDLSFNYQGYLTSNSFLFPFFHNNVQILNTFSYFDLDDEFWQNRQSSFNNFSLNIFPHVFSFEGFFL